LAVTVRGGGGVSDVWIKSLNSDVRLRVSMQVGQNRAPTWTRDGKHLLYASSGTTHAITESSTDGSAAPRRRVESRRAIDVITATPDGEWVVFSEGAFASPRLYAHRRGDSVATRVFTEETPQIQPALSPDGRYLAYAIFDGQLSKAYVSPFPNHGGMKWQVSPNPALHPVWSNSGHELFFRDLVAGTLMAVSVTTGSTFSVGVPRVLFATPGDARYAVANDDSRFLMVRPARNKASSQPRITMIENWPALLAASKP
jgi:Tol biopolymer transport system component